VSALTGDESEEEKKRVKLQIALVARDLKMGALPLERFCSGHVFFVQQLHKTLQPPVEPFVVHTTYQFSQTRGKRQRLREHKLWLVDPPDYHNNGNFIATSEKPPEELLKIGIDNHLKVASWYRLVLRNLFAYAEILNRIPILPEFPCLCDRYWGNILPNCYIHSADVVPPYDQCPMDHVTNLPNLERAGLSNFREYSFLTNKATSDSIKNSIESVSIENFPTDEEIKNKLSGKESSRVLVLTKASKSFCTFVDEIKAQAFDRKINVGLQAESHFCKQGGPTGRICDIGFTIPIGVSTKRGRECEMMRNNEYTFENLFDKMKMN
jgi:hypothetical protein